MVLAAGAVVAVDADVAVAGLKHVLDKRAIAERSHVSAATSSRNTNQPFQTMNIMKIV